MWKVLENRGLRRIFMANMISMMGSGMNAAAVTWHILKATGSEVGLSWLVALQTLPAIVLLPFSGVVIDRQDRRHLVMLLDLGRAAVIATVAALALTHRVQIWHLYLMNTLVALGFWVFWPTMTALIQELTPESEFVDSNSILMAGVQGGWLVAGSLVGFLYNHIGLGWILVIDVATYAVSFLLYVGVRKGRHLVVKEAPETPHVPGVASAFSRYLHELVEGLRYVHHRPAVIVLGTSFALFLGGMLTQAVVTAPLSDRIIHSGAVGYGWMNGAWGVGAFLSALYASRAIKRFGGTACVAAGMAALAFGMFSAPFSMFLVVAILFFHIMGNARGLTGIALSSSMMELVPKHMMGRVQNTFYFAGMILQVCLGFAVGMTAHHWSLTAAFFLIASIYAAGFMLSAIVLAQRSRAPGGPQVAVGAP